MTVGANRMTGNHLRALGGVAGVAAGLQRRRSVRQASVAALAGLVARVGADQLDRPGVAARASAMFRQREHERVRLVAARARNTAVKIMIGRRLLMAAAASLGLIGALARRMRIVAADTRAHHALFGVVGVHVLVAVLAGLLGRVFYVVRRMAARTLVVRAHGAPAENVEVGVTRAAGHSRLFLEIMWPVTTHTFAMPVLKQRRAGDDRLLFGVTRRAGRKGVAGRRVLMLVTRGAGL